MLLIWNAHIFTHIHTELLHAACKLIDGERTGAQFDPRLAIGLRESYGASRVAWQVL